MREPRPRIQLARAAFAVACILAAGWTCTAMLRPRNVASMTLEQCLELVRQGKGTPAVANALRSHVDAAVDALRQCGADGDEHLRRLAEALR